MRLIRLVLVLYLLSSLDSKVYPDTGIASWFSRESCVKEGSGTVMANGEELDDDRLCAGSRKYPIGSRLLVRSIRDSKTVPVVVTTVGPSRRLYRQGRIIDLSVAAFKRLAPLEVGLIQVEVDYAK